MDKDGKVDLGQWFDITRIEILSDKSVMKLPDFSKGYTADGLKGSLEKPTQR